MSNRRVSWSFAIVSGLLVLVLVAVTVIFWNRDDAGPPPIEDPFEADDVDRDIVEQEFSDISPTEARSRIAEAENALYLGEYERVETLLANVVPHRVSDIDFQALLLLADQSRLIDKYRDAIDIYLILREEYPDEALAEDVDLRLGLAWSEFGDEFRAAAIFSDIGERDPALAPYAYLLANEAYRNAGQPDEARNAIARAMEFDAVPRTRAAILELEKEYVRDEGDTEADAAILDELIELATFPNYRANLFYQRAQTSVMSGDVDAAVSDLTIALESGSLGDDLEYVLDWIEDNDLDDDLDPLLLLDAYLDVERLDSASDQVERLVKEKNTDTAGEYYRLLIEHRSDSSEETVRDLVDFAREADHPEYTPEAYDEAAQWYRDQDSPAAARSLERSLLVEFADAANADSVRARLGRNLAEIGFVDRGVEYLVETPSSDTESHYWAGLFVYEEGDSARAEQIWQRIGMSPDGDYYRARAYAQLHHPSLSDALSASPDVHPLTEDAWRRLLPSGSLWLDPADIRNDSRYRLARRLDDAGLSEYAEWAIDGIIREHSDDPAILARTGIALALDGAYREAVQVGNELRTLDDPRYRPIGQRFAFPIAYAQPIRELAEKLGADPLLLLAVIRQESAFDPNAESFAGARGLTQVMPSTGQDIANALDRDDWDPDDLWRPVNSLEFGMLYLRDRVRSYDGDVIRGLAAYNAGGGTVAQWDREFGDLSIDRYVERIPYPETNHYVRQVYANYLTYQKLYR